MARLTGRLIEQEYAPKIETNSFYQEQGDAAKIDSDYYLKRGILSEYYHEENGEILIKETKLLQ